MGHTVFKDIYNESSVKSLSRRCSQHCSSFDAEKFADNVLDGFSDLEMKARIDRITKCLYESLPKDYLQALAIIRTVLTDKGGIYGFEVWPLCQYVEKYGIDFFHESMEALYLMTKHFTSEVPIREFLIHDSERVFHYLKKWVSDSDVNVRRLVSEGTRPRLPWSQRLPEFQDDPRSVIELLEKLKDDPEEYVRRSVANNLNDISKDNPDVVIETVTRWSKGANADMKKLIKHACRSLVKQGYPGIFQVFGYSASPAISDVQLSASPNSIELGEEINISATITSGSDEDIKLLIDYRVFHVKANGSLTPKVYKWKTCTIPAKGSIAINKIHKIKPVTVRKYYPGEHYLELLVNGNAYGKSEFTLTINN